MPVPFILSVHACTFYFISSCQYLFSQRICFAPAGGPPDEGGLHAPARGESLRAAEHGALPAAAPGPGAHQHPTGVSEGEKGFFMGK